MLALLTVTLETATSQNAPSTGLTSSAIIQFLNQTIDWYRQLGMERQVATEPNDLLVVNDNRQIADQVVRLAFDFARAEAQLVTREPSSTQSGTENSEASRYQSLAQLSAKLDSQVRELQVELESLKRKLDTATGRKRRDLQSNIAEVQSELDLTNARRDAIRNMAEFVNGTSANGLGASGLRAQIETLARSLPTESAQLSSNGGNSASAERNPASAVAVSKPEPSGIWGLTADLFSLSGKVHTLDGAIRATDALTQTSKQLRAPLVNSLKQLSQRGDELANQADSADPSTLLQQKKDLDALTAQFKQVSAAVLPLSKQAILLGL